MNTATFTATSVSTATYTAVNPASSERPSGKQALRLMANADASSGSATAELALVRYVAGSATVIARHPATCTVTARRAGTDGASGDYICDVSWAESSTSTIDLLGSYGYDGLADHAEWMIGVTGLTTVASLDLYWETTEVL